MLPLSTRISFLAALCLFSCQALNQNQTKDLFFDYKLEAVIFLHNRGYHMVTLFDEETQPYTPKFHNKVEDGCVIFSAYPPERNNRQQAEVSGVVCMKHYLHEGIWFTDYDLKLGNK